MDDDDDLLLPPGAVLEPDDWTPEPPVHHVPEPPAWRQPWVYAVAAIVAVLVVIVVALAVTGGGGSDGDRSAASTTRPASVRSTTSTTEPTSSTLPDAVLYQELQAQIEQACSQAVESGEAPDVVFQDRWSVVSNPQKLDSAINRCIQGRTDAAIAAAKPVDVDQVLKDPDAMGDAVVAMVVKVTQYDPGTGPCTFRAQWDAEGHAIASMYRGTDGVFTAGDPERGCPALASLDQNDVARVWARVRGTAAVGSGDGAAPVPSFYVLKAEILQKA